LNLANKFTETPEHKEHGHEEHGHEEHGVELSTTTEVTDHSGHEHSGLEGLMEIMFGWEHVLAEVFWNSVWLGAAFAVGRVVTFRRVHKYIDDKHGVSHSKKEY
jgi:hypothetical protein